MCFPNPKAMVQQLALDCVVDEIFSQPGELGGLRDVQVAFFLPAFYLVLENGSKLRHLRSKYGLFIKLAELNPLEPAIVRQLVGIVEVPFDEAPPGSPPPPWPASCCSA